MEEMLSKRNQRDAFQYLNRKKDGYGADGISMAELEDYWKLNKEKVITELKNKIYQPGIVRCTEIVNNKGKRRVISNLSALDRFLSRLLYQKLRRYIEPEFLPCSFAYQENKGVLSAVEKVKEYLEIGCKYVMEIDLKDYFDTIPHEPMLALVNERITDERVTDLIYKYIHCRILQDDKISYKTVGLVQGNAISTVLSNLYLQKLDLYMENCGYLWVRFADNINVYCKNETDAIACYNEISTFVGDTLNLKINEKKSGVYPVLERIFLGYQFYKYAGQYEARKYKYRKTEVYNNWHDSALQKINHEYHLLQNGVLNKRDYALIFENEKEKCDIPVEAVDQLNIYSDITITSSALKMISDRKICVSFVSKYGYQIGTYIPENHSKTSVDFLKQAVYYESSNRFVMAQKMEIAGIHNLRANVKYYNRKNQHLLDQTVDALTQYMTEMRNAKTVDELMLIEAKARHEYYLSFNQILKQKTFRFEKRTRRPPKDELNAMISFGNTLLYNYILQMIWKTTLDPRIGVVHATNRRSYSLNLDFADIFKPVIVDRVIFSLVNLLQIQADRHFVREDGGLVYLSKEGKRIFIEAFEEKLADKITVKEKTYTYKQLIETEVRKFQHHVVDGEKYKPYKYW